MTTAAGQVLHQMRSVPSCNLIVASENMDREICYRRSPCGLLTFFGKIQKYSHLGTALVEQYQPLMFQPETMALAPSLGFKIDQYYMIFAYYLLKLLLLWT